MNRLRQWACSMLVYLSACYLEPDLGEHEIEKLLVAFAKSGMSVSVDGQRVPHTDALANYLKKTRRLTPRSAEVWIDSVASRSWATGAPVRFVPADGVSLAAHRWFMYELEKMRRAP